MTAPTPEQMRALASEHAQEAAEYELDRVEKQDQPEYGDGYEYEDKITWHQNTAAALRTAADQLEAARDIDRIACAIKASKDKHYGPSWDEFRNKPPTQADYGTARLIVAALTADTAPQAETCWACARENTTDVPEGDIPLCTKHWNWWVMRWLNAADKPPCAAHLITAPQESQR